ncbi:MAG: PASTA domain-containing protein [Bacteroidia bacterium]|nr:PASTA domain-containing protein [Bacteroidia bacterium]
MKEWLRFLYSRRFLKHLGLTAGIIGLSVFLVFWWLSAYTDHDEYYSVPDFSGIELKELDRFVDDKNVRFRIIDSVYDAKAPGGTVLRQEPLAGTQVKYNRMIYLYVVATVPQQVNMPNLVDASPRQAVALLESYGLRLKRTVKKPGQSAVLAQLYKGKPIVPGTPLPKGSEIELWIGKGEDGETSGVPCVTGMRMEDAVNEITAAGLAVGAIVCRECKTAGDSAAALVFRQSPGCTGENNVVSSGTSVDIFLTLEGKQIKHDSIPPKEVNKPKEDKKGKGR